MPWTRVPSTRIRFCLKTEIFCSVFKKIRVLTLRFWIVLARTHEIKTEPSWIWACVFTCIWARDVIVFKKPLFLFIHSCTENGIFKSLHSGESLRTADVFPVVASRRERSDDRKYFCGSQATLKSVFEKMRFRWPFSTNTCGRCLCWVGKFIS